MFLVTLFASVLCCLKVSPIEGIGSIPLYMHCLSSRGCRGRYRMVVVSSNPGVGGFLGVFSTNETDCHVIAEILLKVVLNTITLIPNPIIWDTKN